MEFTIDKKRFNKALKSLENAPRETKSEIKKKATKIFRIVVRDVKKITPVDKTGNLKKSVGMKSSLSRDVLRWRILFRNKKAPYASAVNYNENHPRNRFYTDYVEQNQQKIEKQAADAIIKAVAEAW